MEIYSSRHFSQNSHCRHAHLLRPSVGAHNLLRVSGVSSTAWDSVAELVALAMNSPPTEALQNTCAGIIGKKAYETNVRVLKTNKKHLELVFREVKDPNANVSKLVMDENYGRIEKLKEKGDELLKPGAQEGMRKRVVG